MKVYSLTAALIVALASTGAYAAESNKKYELPVKGWLETASDDLVSSNLEYSKSMFDRQENVTNKPLLQLQQRSEGKLETGKLYLGGRLIANQIHEKTNINGKFPILSRLPPNHPGGKTDNESVIADASINGTLTIPWVTLFAQGEYTEVEYPGQDEYQLRKLFATIGDLKEFPVYLTIGKNTVEFGDFTTYAPYTHSMNTHYFWAQNDDDPMFTLGYADDGWHLAATLIKGGRGLCVLNSENDDRYENFALNASKEFKIGYKTKVKLGGGYLYSTIYDSTLAHHPPTPSLPDEMRNGVWDVNATVNYANWDFAAEFTRTTSDWPSTDWPVSALTTQARYNDTLFELPSRYSLVYSRGEQGKDGTAWERMEETIAGFEVDVLPNVSLGTEYIHHQGFVPLIGIRKAAIDDVESHSVLAGAKLTF